MNEYEDTYFFNGQEALRVASEQNRFNNGQFIQVCYYDGEHIKSDLVNLIHLPVDGMLEELARGKYRISSVVNLDGLELSEAVKLEITANFNVSLMQVRNYREQYNVLYLNELKKANLNFDEKLRFYLVANSTTQVMQFVSKSLANTLEKKGYDVMYNLYYGIEDNQCLQDLARFNPHVTININHLNNSYLNDKCFNFVWFQDPMPHVMDSEKVTLRERDYIFSYQTIFTDNLIRKGIAEEKIFKQDVIALDLSEFYLDEDIEVEDKVVFVGSFYKHNTEFITEEIHKDLICLIERGENISEENIRTVFSKHNILIPESKDFINHIQQGYVRNTCVAWLAEIKSINVEVYGYKWEQSGNRNIIDKFKGSVDKFGLNKLYNSSKYVLSASGQLINTQRLGEAVHTGAIPIVYDSRNISDEENKWDDECLWFKTKEELEAILKSHAKPKKYRTQKMLDYFTYNEMIDTMLEQIKQNS